MAKILIVEARFYEHLNDLLLEGARAAMRVADHVVDLHLTAGAHAARALDACFHAHFHRRM